MKKIPGRDDRTEFARSVAKRVARSILSSLGACLVALDSKGRILSVFPRAGHGRGYTHDDLVGKDFDSVFRGSASRVGMRSGNVQEITTVEDPDGKNRTFELRGVPSQNAFKEGLARDAAEFKLVSELPSRPTGATTRETDERPSLTGISRLEELNRRLVRKTRRLKRELETLERRNRRNVKEMNLAVDLQKSLLPKSYPDTPHVTFTHRYIPFASVGGDLFSIVALDDDRIGFLLSDVSGHGVAPAFITAMVRSSFDYLHQKNPDPAALMGELNREFSKIIETDHFITAFYAVFDFKAMTMRYSNAGHPPQLLFRADGRAIELGPTDPIIGMIDDHVFREAEAALEPGDLLCFYTDGIVESRDAADEMFGIGGVKRVVGSRPGLSLDETADTLLAELIQYMKDPSFDDDITLVLAQITGVL